MFFDEDNYNYEFDDNSEDDNIDYDYRIFKDFLGNLDPEATAFTFVTLGEGNKRDDSKLRKELHGSADEHYATLRRLNEAGAGVFVVVNETDLKGRKKDNITSVRAIWQDDDGGFDDDYPLPPSMTVETSPGRYHRYWLLDEALQASEEGKELFNGMMARMVETYGADSRAKNIGRILRVPGFSHNKDEPFAVSFTASNERYSLQQLREAFPPVDRAGGEVTTQETVGALDKGRVESASLFLHEATKGSYFEKRDTWLRVGMALHYEINGGPEGKSLWDELSNKYSGDFYDNKELLDEWQSFSLDHDNPTTLHSFFKDAYDLGWQDDLSDRPVTWMPEGGELTRRTMKSIRKQFDEWGHRPSENHWKGIEEIAKAIEHMANGTLEKDYYLSSLPPGMGKTTTLTHAIRHLANMKEYAETGVIIFLSRLEEIRKLVKAMNLDENDYSVVTSKEDFNALGNQNKTQARVMFTTQQMLESMCKKHSKFSEMDDFKFTGAFNGEPRTRDVRVWDETISPAMTITIKRRRLGKLLDELGDNNKEASNAVERFMKELEAVESGSLVTVPEFDSYLSSSEAQSLFNEKALKDLVSELWVLSGRTCRVRRDGNGKSNADYNTVLDYEDILPEDLPTMVILDASGLTRHTYRLWHQDRKGLRFLYSPPKSYTNLTIHVCNKASGKSAYKNHGGKEHVEGIAKTIDEEVPHNEDAFLVRFKENEATKIDDIHANVERRVRELREQDPLHCPFDEFGTLGDVTYGQHTAVNDFRDCKYAFVAGVYTYPNSEYEAIARAARNIASEEEISVEVFNKVKLGEQRHNIFQGTCRGAVRKAFGDDCPEGCHLYIYVSDARVRKGLQQIFPGAKIVEWEPILRVTDKVVKAADYLISMCDNNDGNETEVTKSAIIDHVVAPGGDKNRSNFNATVFDKPEIERYLKEKNYGYRNARGRVIVWAATK